MMRRVVIHQPDFLPYLGFFDRLLNADLFVILDCVQFVHSSRSWTNRDKIKTPQGEQWLTVSLRKCKRDTQIREVELSQDVDWREKNLFLLHQNYHKAPFYYEIHPYMENLYHYDCFLLMDFNVKSINILCELFNINIEMVYASDLDCRGTSNELLVDILKKVKADCYLSGVGAKNYFDPVPFNKAGIQVIWQEFRHPVYPQLYNSFIPSLSGIDLLYNCGIKKSRDYLRSKL